VIMKRGGRDVGVKRRRGVRTKDRAEEKGGRGEEKKKRRKKRGEKEKNACLEGKGPLKVKFSNYETFSLIKNSS